jgi:hypothetical protein
MIVAKPHTRNRNLPLGIESSAFVRPELWVQEGNVKESKGGGREAWMKGRQTKAKVKGCEAMRGGDGLNAG